MLRACAYRDQISHWPSLTDDNHVHLLSFASLFFVSYVRFMAATTFILRLPAMATPEVTMITFDLQLWSALDRCHNWDGLVKLY